MGGLDDYKPAMAMIALQFSYAAVSLSTRAALLQGMSPWVFIVYSQAMATLVVAPIAYFSRKRSTSTCSLGLRSFCLIFLASLFGVTINQNAFLEGLYFSSSSIATAMSNLVPAITFVMAFIIGLEKVNIRSLRSIGKIVGTMLCVIGAVCMALVRGPKLLNAEFLHAKSVFSSGGDENWLLGCLFVFVSCSCWSLWLILQVPASVSYPDPLSVSAWTCFFATLQSAMVALYIERDPLAWNIHSPLEIACCLFSGIIGSGLTFFVQAWCISRRGPLFSAMFNTLCTVISTIFAAIFLHHEVYTGSLIGALGVITGLYVVLRGKAKEPVKINEETDLKLQDDKTGNVKILIDDSSEKTNCKIDLEEPLLSDKSSNIDESGTCNKKYILPYMFF